jgi:hypothetical protein
MTEQTVNIYAPNGARVGYFVNPVVEMLPEHHYIISGEFRSPEGLPYPKVEFNPQVLPYTADLSTVTKCSHDKIVAVYVQRGRQPVKMTGSCPN